MFPNLKLYYKNNIPYKTPISHHIKINTKDIHNLNTKIKLSGHCKKNKEDIFVIYVSQLDIKHRSHFLKYGFGYIKFFNF